jgi:hypothetical protein
MKMKSLRVIKGEGQLIMVRGKKKLGYEMDIECELENGEDGKTCKVYLTEVCDDDDDCSDIRVEGIDV